MSQLTTEQVQAAFDEALIYLTNEASNVFVKSALSGVKVIIDNTPLAALVCNALNAFLAKIPA